MKEELAQEEKTREERAPRARSAKDAVRDKEPPGADAGSRRGSAASHPEGARATAAAKAGASEAGKKAEARSEAKKETSDLRRQTPDPASPEAAPASGHGGASAGPEAPGYSPGAAGVLLRRDAASRDKEAVREQAPREIRDLRGFKDYRDPRDDKDELIRALKMLAPGTPLREGLESILRAKMGALIILGDSPEILDLAAGGFRIDTDFTSPSIYELAKMDGAIILSDDARQILYANTQLVPDPLIPSEETGIRHRTAQRFAFQTGAMVIAISHRRGVITLYRGSLRYILREIGVILSKANQAIQTLERYKRVLDKALVNLTALEFEELVTVFDVAKVVQRGEMVLRIVRELESYIVELGVEGRLVTMQAEELVVNVEDEIYHVLQDYHAAGDRSVAEIKQHLGNFSSEDLLELSNFSRTLGYGSAAGILDLAVFPHGYRILHKIPKLPSLVIENLVQNFVRLQNIVKASIEELDAVEGIGEARARAIKNGMRRLQEQVMLDRYM